VWEGPVEEADDRVLDLGLERPFAGCGRWGRRETGEESEDVLQEELAVV